MKGTFYKHDKYNADLLGANQVSRKQIKLFSRPPPSPHVSESELYVFSPLLLDLVYQL